MKSFRLFSRKQTGLVEGELAWDPKSGPHHHVALAKSLSLWLPYANNKLVGLFSFRSDIWDLTKQGKFPQVGQQCFLWTCKRINGHATNKAFGVCLYVEGCFQADPRHFWQNLLQTCHRGIESTPFKNVSFLVLEKVSVIYWQSL